MMCDWRMWLELESTAHVAPEAAPSGMWEVDWVDKEGYERTTLGSNLRDAVCAAMREQRRPPKI
jgi:hypothetical protein